MQPFVELMETLLGNLLQKSCPQPQPSDKKSCPQPQPSDLPSGAQLRRLGPLLAAHKTALASQTVCLDAAGLLETFEPLQQLVRGLQGICAHKRLVRERPRP